MNIAAVVVTRKVELAGGTVIEHSARMELGDYEEDREFMDSNASQEVLQRLVTISTTLFVSLPLIRI